MTGSQRHASLVERYGDVIVLLCGVAVLAAGIAAPNDAAGIGLCGIGAALVVLAVVLTRTEGRLKIGAQGLEADLIAVKREAISESEQLNATLAAGGLDLSTVASEGKSIANAANADEIRQMLDSLLTRVARLDEANEARSHAVPASVLLEAAHGLMASQQWAEAARYFDRLIAIGSADWDALFSRAVAHSNARGGPESDLRALRAYNDAIALRPAETDLNLLARVFSYRGAMLKRLGRLREAEADLHVARGLATAAYEKQDIAYNLACVYALAGRTEEAIGELRLLSGSRHMAAVVAHLDDYFAEIADEPAFLAALETLA